MTDANTVKAALQGRWADLFAHCGIPGDCLDGRHHPCPKCGGKDRFRVLDAERGALFCNQCFNRGNGDGLSGLQWWLGCDFPEAIRLAAEFAGLGDNKSSKPSGNGQAKREKKPEVFPTARAAVHALEGTLGPRSALWTYRDAQGQPVGLVCRWNRPDGSKDIRPIAKCDGGWRIGAMPEPRPLYRLPQLLAADPDTPIWIGEGEKVTGALVALGLVATTSAGGSQAAAKSDWQPLKGRKVIIAPDNDSPGRGYAQAVAEAAHAVGAREVRILDLGRRFPGLPEGADLGDIVSAPTLVGLSEGTTPDELRTLLERLAAEAETWTPAAKPEPGPVLVRMADVEPRAVSWLWPARIPLGRLSLINGRPGDGKSFLTADFAARVSTATPWPDGSPCPRGDVLILSAEDDPRDVIRPRLDAHFADVSKCHLLAAVRRVADDGKTYEAMVSLADIGTIEEALRRLPDCKLVIIDPIGSFLGGGTDAHRDNEVRGVLAPVARLAEKYGPAVVVIAHRRKSAGSVADDVVLGSRAFTGIARAVWHVTRDTSNGERRLFLPGKNNLAATRDGLAFSIAGEPASVHWERAPVAMTADQALAFENQNRDGQESEALDAAVAWLREALSGGPRMAKDLKDEWRNGEGGSDATLRRAKDALGAESFREQVPGPWWWRLPPKETKETQDAHQEAQGAHDEHLEHLEHLGEMKEPIRPPSMGGCGGDGDAERPQGAHQEAQDAQHVHLEHLEHLGPCAHPEGGGFGDAASTPPAPEPLNPTPPISGNKAEAAASPAREGGDDGWEVFVL